MNLKEGMPTMNKLGLLLVFVVMLFALASCSDPEIAGYHIDENGDLIVTYTDTTTENLGKFGNDAINTIDTIAISDDGFYVLNGVKTSIVAVDVFDVKFVTGYDTTVKNQIVKDGDKVERPQIERAGYTLKGWYCNGEEWRFNSDVVLNKMTLTAEWIANDYTVSFNTEISDTLPNQTITFGSEYSLPTLERKGYTFKGWEYKGEFVTADKWNIADNCTLTAKWEVNKYTVTINSNGGTVPQKSVEITYGNFFELPVAQNEYGVFRGWFYGDTQLTDSYGHSLSTWSFLTDIEVTTSWIIELSTQEDLQQLRQFPNGQFILINDIVISGSEWIPIGTDEVPFTGVINGNQQSIIGLTITTMQDDAKYYGLIGKSDGGSIFDLSLKEVKIELPLVTNSVYIGALAAYCEGTNINNVTVAGNISVDTHNIIHGSYAGGICGYSDNATIVNSSNYTNIRAQSCAGGILGYAKMFPESGFSNNKNFGSIQARIAGGVIGSGIDCDIEKCCNMGSVTGNEGAGGLVGSSRGSIRIIQVYNTGKIVLNYTYDSNVDTTNAGGGIVGTVYANNDFSSKNSSITNSYNTGEIQSNVNAGGIVGSFQNFHLISIFSCYNDGKIYGKYYAGGIIGKAEIFEVKDSANFGNIERGELRAIIGMNIEYASISNCYYNCSTSYIDSVQGTKISDKYSKNFYKNSLFWDERIWEFYDDKLPSLN